jgi:hypothetical protein
MSNFAEIDEENKVIRVLVGDDNLPNEGYDWFVETLGGRWVKTSFNGNFRKNFANVGFTYDPELDAFIPPKPFESWVLDEETAQWEAPVAYPDGGASYVWNEETASWQLLEPSE